MQHRRVGKKFHRLRGQRRAFMRGLADNLIRHGRIETTEVRAKAVRPLVERLITIARRGDLASRRLVTARLQNKDTARRLMDDVAPRYVDRQGGYTRIIKHEQSRKRDGAPVATIEFV